MSSNMRVKTLSLPVLNSGINMFRSSPLPVTESAKSDSELDDARELRLKLQRSQEDNIKLQAVITDLTQVNKRWQKYNNDRQLYVQKLLNTIQDQQEQLNHIGELSYHTSSSVGQSSASSGICCDMEVERLRSVEQKLNEKVSILEFQVKAHRDDWEAELSEKKQALKDKQVLERRLAQLISETSDERGERLELYCQNCGRMTDFDHSPPPHNRVYRTAVHLPCSSSQHSSTTSISTNGDELVVDCRGGKHVEAQREDTPDTRKTRGLKPEETSYSRSSTAPLVTGTVAQSALGSAVTRTHSSSSSLGENTSQPNIDPFTVKSFMQIPIAKSSSVPEGGASRFPELPRMSLDSFNYTSHVPPVASVNSFEQYDGVETLSSENVICLRCGDVFPPNKHLQFLDHFPRCRSRRSHKVASKDSEPSV